MEVLVLVFTFLSLVVVGIQLWVMSKQMSIMERQDKIFARKSNLIMLGNYDAQENHFVFTIKNIGERGTSNWYWHLNVPIELSSAGNAISSGFPIASKAALSINGAEYKNFNTYVTEMIYPTRLKDACIFPLPKVEMKGTFKFAWQIISEDGITPGLDDQVFGWLEINV